MLGSQCYLALHYADALGPQGMHIISMLTLLGSNCQESQLQLSAATLQNAYQWATQRNALPQLSLSTLQDLLHTSNTAYGGAPPRWFCCLYAAAAWLHRHED